MNLDISSLPESEQERIQNEIAKAEKRVKDEQSKKLVEEKAREARAAEREKEVRRLTKELLDADTNNLIRTDEKGRLHFNVPGSSYEHYISIEMRQKCSKYSFRTSDVGMQYCMDNITAGYGIRWYKNPKTVIRKIEEAIEVAKNKIASAEAKQNMIDWALGKLKEQYPNCEIEYQAEQLRTNWCSYKPVGFVVKAEQGSVTFRFGHRHNDAGELERFVEPANVRVASNLTAEVAKQILEGTLL